MKNQSYSWTSPSGENYEVRQDDKFYYLYKNGWFTQNLLPITTHREQAIAMLLQMEREECEAERVFYANHPELNP